MLLQGGSSLQSIDRGMFRGMAVKQAAPSSPFSSGDQGVRFVFMAGS